MKAWEYDAVVLDGEIYCVTCLSEKELRNAAPIFADSEWTYYPTCSECGAVHEYVTLTPDT